MDVNSFYVLLLIFGSTILISCHAKPIMLTQSETPYRLVCYHTNWAQYRNEAVKFTPDNIDPSLCTHMIYSFAKIGNDHLIQPYEWNDESTEWMEGNYEKFTNLKLENPDLQLLLAVGGWTHGTEPFTAMVESATSRKAFIDDVIEYLRYHNFDGLDLDWEFPAARGSPSQDKVQFTILCQELRAAFEAEAESTGNPRLLLSAAVSAGYSYIDAGYEIVKVSEALDFLSVMAYDLRGSWESVTGHHTALYPGSDDSEHNAKLTVQYAVDKWIGGGCPPKKLNMGLGTYGRAFKLAGFDTSIGASTSGASTPGPYTREGGFLAYYEICEKLDNGFTRVFDNERMIPYAYGKGEWVGYDDTESLIAKTDLIKTRGLGGGMVWALDLDDFTGELCGEGKWPLLTAIKTSLAGEPQPNSGESMESDSGEEEEEEEEEELDDEDDEEENVDEDEDENDNNGEDNDGSDSGMDGDDDEDHDHNHDHDHDEDVDEGEEADEEDNNGGDNDDLDSSMDGDDDEEEDHDDGDEEEVEEEDNNDEEPDIESVSFSCEGRSDRLYSDPLDCSSFYHCWGNGRYIAKTSCQSNLVFNPTTQSCDWPYNYECTEQEADTDKEEEVGGGNEDNADEEEGEGDGDGVEEEEDNNDEEPDIESVPFSCEGRSDRLYSDPLDCSSFYHCWGNGKHIARTTCQSNLVFNPTIQSCDWSYNYECTR